MSSSQTNSACSDSYTTIAIAWCLAWGEGLHPQNPEVVEQMRHALQNNQPLPDLVQPFLAQAEKLNHLPFPALRSDLIALVRDNQELWNAQIGLVYGGATKIKQYVFEAAKLSDIRGASALLDRINLKDIPGFFGHPDGSPNAADWLETHFSGLRSALIPELLVYYKGGSILTFCPAGWVNQLADAIEKRYTYETLTANSCAVGDKFRLLEIRLGLLQDSVEKTHWFDSLQANWTENPALRAYFDLPEPKDKEGQPANPNLGKAFSNRKNFNELVGKLATQFNQRRSGFDVVTAETLKLETETSDRPSRRYPPMFETHPYLVRDDNDRRSAVVQVPADQIPGEPTFSEPLARKHRVGQITKREGTSDRWYTQTFDWRFGEFDSWVFKFKTFLADPKHQALSDRYYEKLPTNFDPNCVEEARSLREIGDASNESTKGFVAYIYADGNNMGQYIRDKIKTPEDYQQFSEDIFAATTQATYYALGKHLHSHYYRPDAQSSRKQPAWIHPFEIVTIGGDDVLLIVPANKALEIAKTLGEQFEVFLEATGRYSLKQIPNTQTEASWHRYKGKIPQTRNSCLSISSGVLITADNTPIYYAEKLVSQLLKSAKKKAKSLEGYAGGTVDFLTLKAVTMISSNIKAFRQEGLTSEYKDPQTNHEQVLKLYATPYTLHELDGLLETVRSLKASKFPQSQLYQIRSLLERGKRTAILNYHYFRVRLSSGKQNILKDNFEQVWCKAETNGGYVAPWLTPTPDTKKTTYETIWRELVELLPFIDEEESSTQESSPTEAAPGGIAP